MTTTHQTQVDPLALVPCRQGEADHLGLSLRYWVWGNPKNPPIIFQHGGKDHARSWDFVISHFVDRYCCIAPDLRGHGDSARPTGGSYSTSSFVCDFAAVIDALKKGGIDGPFGIVGHSLGGYITLHYAGACTSDVCFLANIEGLGNAPSRYQAWLGRSVEETWSQAILRRRAIMGRDRRTLPFDRAVEKLAAVHPTLAREKVAYLVRHGAKASDDGLVWKHDDAIDYTMVSAVPPEKNAMVMKAVQSPTALFYGGESFLGPFTVDDARFDNFSDRTVYFYDDAGHWLHHEELNRFVDDLSGELALHVPV